MLIQRVPTTDGGVGPISRILNQNVNADTARTRGVDSESIWAFDPDFVGSQSESFTIRGLVGRLAENSTTTAAGTTQDQVGAGLPSGGLLRMPDAGDACRLGRACNTHAR